MYQPTGDGQAEERAPPLCDGVKGLHLGVVQPLWQGGWVQLQLKAAAVVVQQQHPGRLDPVGCKGRGEGGEMERD